MTRKLTSWFYIEKSNISLGNQWQNVPVSPMQGLHYNVLLLSFFYNTEISVSEMLLSLHISINMKASYLKGMKWKIRSLSIPYFPK